MNDKKQDELRLSQIDESFIDKQIDLLDRIDSINSPVKQVNDRLFVYGVDIVFGLIKSGCLWLLWNALAPSIDWLPEIGFVQACAIYFLPKLILKGEF